jgi:hypothetical protein
MYSWLIAQLAGKLLPRIVIALVVLVLLITGAHKEAVKPLLELLLVKESPQHVDPQERPLKRERTRAVSMSTSED